MQIDQHLPWHRYALNKQIFTLFILLSFIVFPKFGNAEILGTHSPTPLFLTTIFLQFEFNELNIDDKKLTYFFYNNTFTDKENHHFFMVKPKITDTEQLKLLSSTPPICDSSPWDGDN